MTVLQEQVMAMPIAQLTALRLALITRLEFLAEQTTLADALGTGGRRTFRECARDALAAIEALEGHGLMVERRALFNAAMRRAAERRI